MSDQIAFNVFPTNFYVSGTYVEYSAWRRAGDADRAAEDAAHRQKLAAGTATAGTAVQISAPSGGALRRAAARCCITWRSSRLRGDVQRAGVDHAAETRPARKATRTLTSPARRRRPARWRLTSAAAMFNVASAADPTAVAAAIVTAVQADDCGTSMRGRCGRGHADGAARRHRRRRRELHPQPLLDEALPAGIAVAIGTTAGTGNPDIADALASIPNAWFTAMTMPWTDAANQTALKTELLRRNGPIEQIEGKCFVGVEDSVANELAWAASRNCQFICPLDNDTLSPKWVAAASECSISATLAQSDPGMPENRQEMVGSSCPLTACVATSPSASSCSLAAWAPR